MKRWIGILVAVLFSASGCASDEEKADVQASPRNSGAQTTAASGVIEKPAKQVKAASATASTTPKAGDQATGAQSDALSRATDGSTGADGGTAGGAEGAAQRNPPPSLGPLPYSSGVPSTPATTAVEANRGASGTPRSVSTPAPINGGSASEGAVGASSSGPDKTLIGAQGSDTEDDLAVWIRLLFGAVVEGRPLDPYLPSDPDCISLFGPDGARRGPDLRAALTAEVHDVLARHPELAGARPIEIEPGTVERASSKTGGDATFLGAYRSRVRYSGPAGPGVFEVHSLARLGGRWRLVRLVGPTSGRR